MRTITTLTGWFGASFSSRSLLVFRIQKYFLNAKRCDTRKQVFNLRVLKKMILELSPGKVGDFQKWRKNRRLTDCCVYSLLLSFTCVTVARGGVGRREIWIGPTQGLVSSFGLFYEVTQSTQKSIMHSFEESYSFLMLFRCKCFTVVVHIPYTRWSTKTLTPSKNILQKIVNFCLEGDTIRREEDMLYFNPAVILI